MLEFKIKKPEESSLNWKPWHKDWDAITSNYSKDDDNTINDDDKYRYNRKGFLEDDESSDDSIFIVDPGWDDYSLQAIKSNRPIPLCPEARRARIVENVVDHLTITGITAIPGERRSIEELEGMSWHLKLPEQTSVRVPSKIAVNERLNRSVSHRFERYRQTPQPPRYSVDQHDREVIGNDNLDEDEEHFIGICLQAPQEEHISYDVCFCESCLNEAMILEEEPLNKVRRSNKPKRSGQSVFNQLINTAYQLPLDTAYRSSGTEADSKKNLSELVD
ncbi:hypothetical protein Tco_0678136 [Tanacetum coccineum]|uniref:Uncharacterized protein n=1 Tax=Tanacetum coccineum TaxID=301880 RepID=A0ABQ4XE55_9ASTR